MKFALKFHSYSYVTAQNALQFLCSPVTIVCLLILLLFLFVMTCFESCILSTGFQASAGGFRMSCSQLLFSSLRRGREAFHIRRLPAAVPLLSYALISNLYFIYQIFYRINPFCTYLPIILSSVPAKIMVIFLILVIAADAFYHMFSFSYMYLANDSRKESNRKSRLIFSSHRIPVISAFLLTCTATVLLWHLLRTISFFCIQAAVVRLAAEDIRTALTLTLCQYAILITLAIAVTVGSIIHAGIISILFHHYSEFSAGEEIIVYKMLIPKKMRRLLFRSAAALMLAIVIYLYYGIYNGTIQAERAVPFIQIAAHRGVSSEAPENTIPAIELAIDYLADSVEIDVQCTKDGEVVLFHDTSLKRVTGRSRALENMTWEELSKLDAGSFLSPQYKGTPIPLLSDVMDLVKGRINLIIELKRNKSGDELAEKVIELIDEYGMEHQCVIQSSDYQYLRQVKELRPDLTVGYILSTAIGNYYNNEYIDFFCVRSAFLTRSTINQAHAAGKQIFAWTVNTQDELERMKRIQVDAIITDYPIRAREILYRSNENYLLMQNSESPGQSALAAQPY